MISGVLFLAAVFAVLCAEVYRSRHGFRSGRHLIIHFAILVVAILTLIVCMVMQISVLIRAE